MDYLEMLVLGMSAFLVITAKGEIDNNEVVVLIPWQETVQEVRNTNSLAQVLQEYVEDIKLVEAAGSMCSNPHRDRYTRVRSTLDEEMEYCVMKKRTKETLMKCVENRIRSTVSDVRNHIMVLKDCLDNT